MTRGGVRGSSRGGEVGGQWVRRFWKISWFMIPCVQMPCVEFCDEERRKRSPLAVQVRRAVKRLYERL